MRGKVPCLRSSSHRCRITPAYAGKSSGSKIFRVLPWDHPRICGEKPSGQHGADFAAGITPAYAGKRTTLDCLEVLRRDHPRICGEKLSCSASLESMRGSPPHMRGKVYSPSSPYITSGITPAYAGKRNEISFRWNGRKDHPRICGKSSQLRRWPGVMRDHPRICGEKSALTNCLLFPLGSPPHMRGKAFLPTPAMVLSRITPAYAGKSKLSPNCIVVKRDHPRICGEKSQHIGARYIPKGSPPHMRGKASCLYFRVPLTGITPAYAGKSYRERYGHHQGRDHPRICGEKSTRKRRTDSTLGSPPHMRGKVLSFVFRLNRDGITPAYAGKSSRSRFGRCGERDHPRICGEKPAPGEIRNRS